MATTLTETARETTLSVRAARRRLEDAVLDAHEAGASQRAISADIDRSQPEVARLINRARQRRQRPWLTAAEHATEIDREVERGDPDFALRLVRVMLDTFRSLRPGDRAAFLARRPIVGTQRWDTLVRVTMGWACREVDVPAPAWCLAPALDHPWVIRPEPALLGRVVQGTPGELAVVGIWLDAESLRGL